MMTNEREIYKCPVCFGTEFIQTVTEEHHNIYNAEEHVVERVDSMSRGGEWVCTVCKTPIPLKSVQGMFHGVSYKGYFLLDLAEKLKELEEFRRRIVDD